MGPKRWEVRVSVIWRYFVYSVFITRYSRSLNSPPFLMTKGFFKSNIMLFNGPKETRGACVCDLEIFYILTPGTLISLKIYFQSKYISTKNSGS